MNKETRANVLEAMHGEAFAYARYELFAAAAGASGDVDLAETLRGIANVELNEHFRELAELIELAGADEDNLAAAIQDESAEVEETYRAFAAQARAAGEVVVAERFEEILEDEREHMKTLEGMLERIEAPA